MMKTCQDYEMDLMHKASGEVEYIKDKAGLEQHLKECPVCQEVYRGFTEVDAFAAVTRTPSEQYQKKIAQLRRRAEQGPYQAVKHVDITSEVGFAAGKIFNYLEKEKNKNGNGKISLSQVRINTRLTYYHLYEGIGWLAKEQKISISKDNKTAYAMIADRQA